MVMGLSGLERIPPPLLSGTLHSYSQSATYLTAPYPIKHNPLNILPRLAELHYNPLHILQQLAQLHSISYIFYCSLPSYTQSATYLSAPCPVTLNPLHILPFLAQLHYNPLHILTHLAQLHYNPLHILPLLAQLHYNPLDILPHIAQFHNLPHFAQLQ